MAGCTPARPKRPPTMNRPAPGDVPHPCPSAAAPPRLLLLAHGSRQPQWAHPFERVLERLRAGRPGVDAELCFLESMSPRLSQALEACAAAGQLDLLVVPLFLGSGAHLVEDVARQVEAACDRHPGLRVRVMPAAGDSPLLWQALADYALGCLGATPPR